MFFAIWLIFKGFQATKVEVLVMRIAIWPLACIKAMCYPILLKIILIRKNFSGFRTPTFGGPKTRNSREKKLENLEKT